MATGKAEGRERWTSKSNFSLFLSLLLSSPLLVSMRSPVRSARIREGAAPQGMQCAHRNQRGYALKPEMREAAQKPRRKIPKNQQKKSPNGIRKTDKLIWELTVVTKCWSCGSNNWNPGGANWFKKSVAVVPYSGGVPDITRQDTF